ncbi:ubiquinol-cytochrome-c reductase complex assembly factor 2 [Dermacentor andersoni]|uniref:ubiquinol-cytochrome-c reductase complex assembly factor 2 n=1 Tax=Dermacentor andersoni TaxID=34620 RepID=UPI00215587CF|nr:ubiquinol-cytochrome-c reductase complex assembly factor 2-like [Dermacentor andersoni]
MAGGNLYREYMKICSAWRADPARSGKCLGEFVRRRVAEEFRQSEQTVVQDPQECERRLDSLRALASDRYAKQYPRISVSSALGLTRAECSKVIVESLHTAEGVKEDQSLLEKLKERLSFKTDIPESPPPESKK